MKKMSLIFLLLIGVTFVLRSQTNLVVNGSMDDWSQTGGAYNPLPDHFVAGSSSPSTYATRVADGKTGSHALKITAGTSHRRFGSETMDLEEGEYIAKVWVKGKGLLRWVTLTKEGTTPGSVSGSANFVFKPMGGDTETYTKDYSDWTELTCPYTIPAGKYNMHFSFMYATDDSKPLLLDDISLVKKTNEQPVFDNTLYPTDDTFIKGADQGTDINGMLTTMETYLGVPPRMYSRESYLRFDLQGMTNPDLLKDVKLRIFAIGTAQPNIHPLDLHYMSETDWTEDGVHSDNKALLGTSLGILKTLETSLAESRYYEWDITEEIKQYLTSQSNPFITFGLLEAVSQKTSGGSSIIVKWHTKENTNRPMLVYSLKDTESLVLTNLLKGGVQMPGFDPQTFFYEVELPFETADNALPLIEAVAQNNTSLSYTRATNLSGSIAERTTQIKVTHNVSGETLIYKVLFTRLPADNDPRLSTITIDGATLETFKMDNETYHQYLPYSYQNIPTVNAVTHGRKSTFIVTPPTNIKGSETERTALVTVTSGDESQTKTYKVTFEVMPKLDLFLCIGQSNMAGRGYLDASKGDYDPIDNAFLLTPGSNWEPASNPMNKHSAVRKDNTSQRMSPSYAFAKKTAETITTNPIGMVVNARGATGISSWLKNSVDTLYKSSIRRAKEAQKWGEFKAILWHQGEGNSSPSGALTYPGYLTQLVKDLRADLGNENLFFVAGELAYWRITAEGEDNSSAFNAMINTISTFIDNSACVSASGLSPLNGDVKDPHFDRESQLILGERYADVILKEIYGMENGQVSKTGEHSKQTSDKVIISENGKAKQVVVIPSATFLKEAQLLTRVLGEISGGTFSFALGDGKTGIAIGTTSDFPDIPFKPKFSKSDIRGKQGYEIKTHSNGVYIIGATPQAVSYAVSEFLRLLEYRFFFAPANWEVIPSNPNLELAVHVREIPDYFSRNIWPTWGFWPEYKDNAVWDATNRNVGYKLNTSHIYEKFISDNISVFNGHPEYYALSGGVRNSHKLCISNPDLRTLFANYVVSKFENDATLESFSVEPSDRAGWCECSQCAALGSISTRAVLLANTAAEAVSAKFSGKKLGMYAYSYHCAPPSIDVHPIIVVNAATSFIRDGWSYDDILSGWKAKKATIGIRDYYSLGYWPPVKPGGSSGSDFNYLTQSIPNYLEKEARYMSAEASDDWGPNGLGYYIASNLLWNVETDMEPLLLDFLNKSFAGAAEPMKDFYTLMYNNPGTLSEKLIGGMYKFLENGLQLVSEEKVAARLYDLAIYTRICELLMLFEANQTTGNYTQLMNFIISTKRSRMVHSYAMYREPRYAPAAIRDQLPAFNWENIVPPTKQELDTYIANGISEYGTALPSLSAQESIIYAERKQIIIKNQGSWDYAVYLLTGRAIVCGTYNDQVKIPVNPGLYIVKTGDKTKKVFVP